MTLKAGRLKSAGLFLCRAGPFDKLRDPNTISDPNTRSGPFDRLRDPDTISDPDTEPGSLSEVEGSCYLVFKPVADGFCKILSVPVAGHGSIADVVYRRIRIGCGPVSYVRSPVVKGFGMERYRCKAALC